MSKHMLRAFLNLVRAWSLCLLSAAIAYFTIAGSFIFLTSDIAELIVNNVITTKLTITIIIVFAFLNALLMLTYAASLFIIRHEKVFEGLRKNGRILTKGFIFLSSSSLVSLALMTFASYQAVSLTSLEDGLRILAMSYGAGVIIAVLLTLPLVWLVTSLVDKRLWIGFGGSSC